MMLYASSCVFFATYSSGVRALARSGLLHIYIPTFWIYYVVQKVGENAVYYLAYAIYYGRASRRDILFPGISAGEASSGVARVVVGIRVYGRVLGVLPAGEYTV